MLHGLTGSLLSHYFAEHLLNVRFAGQLGEASADAAYRRMVQWWRRDGLRLGPASSVRTIWERGCVPLAEILGFDPPRSPSIVAASASGGSALMARVAPGISLMAGGWTESLDAMWRNAVRAAIAAGDPWCLCTNGRELRLVDARRTYARAHLQFDIERSAEDRRLFAVLWGMLRADAFRSVDTPLVLQAALLSTRHGAAVSRALRHGVVEAVGALLSGLLDGRTRRRASLHADELAAGFDEALTLVYRVLFLMFAEARGLVPNWHPIYRDRYTVESLRDEAERVDGGAGMWETLQAISRLAHQGCHAGTLIVSAFNGRLFSPRNAPLAAACAMSDAVARRALLALSTASGGKKRGRVRIDYRDLGVEQLGAVYESVLDYEPAPARPGAEFVLRRGGGRRKATGSFYTPQSLTDYVVRRTLHPLVDGATPDRILQLRIVDPAMGSAAFLVAACRYLARAYEQALVRDGVCGAGDIDESDRAGFRRQVAQRCLYGVDLDPAAVQLARLSLWLATLSADKPLTFLDHRLATGDSLTGASPADLAARPPSGRAGTPARSSAPLFTDADLEPLLGPIVSERQWLAETPDDRLDVVREKELRLERIAAGRWKRLADLWCACWMWPAQSRPPNAAVYAALSDFILRDRTTLPHKTAAPLLETAESIARARRFFHWPFEFPEAYFDAGGRPLPNPGFDAVLGNPPWDMLRADDGAGDAGRAENTLIKNFVRGSGIYRFQGGGHANRYQLFVERAMGLLRNGGRLGFVLPAGFATDHTSSPLRRRLFERHDVDTLVGFDNRRGIFPIHRGVRFMLCTATSGRPSSRIPCRFGIDDPSMLDALPDRGDAEDDALVVLTPPLVARISGDGMAIPDIRSSLDLRIVEKIAHRFPRLSDPEGWGAKFGRELNATDDRRHFHRGRGGLPVLEGKHIEPFRVHVDHSENRISEKSAAMLLDSSTPFQRTRLAYRDVASSTNRVSLIAALLPPGVVTTHSLFCLKTPLDRAAQAFLCGILNSYAANYLVRQLMTTHLGSTTVERLRVPKLPRGSLLFEAIVWSSERLAETPSAAFMSRLQGLAGRAYELDAGEFRRIVATFPLVSEEEREQAVEEFVAWRWK